MTGTKRWGVVCDDERWVFSTRARAREWAARVNRHPANANIRMFGPYRNVDGVARLVDLRWETWGGEPRYAGARRRLAELRGVTP